MSQHRFTSIVPHNTNYDFVGLAPKFLMMSGIILVCSLLGLVFFGINWGVEFAGGTEIQVAFKKSAQADQVREALNKGGFPNATVQQFGPAESNEFLLRVERISVLTPEIMKKVEDGLKSTFGDRLLAVESNEREGDRINVFLKPTLLPPAAAPDGTPPAADAKGVITDQTLEPNGQKMEQVLKAAGLELRPGESRKSVLGNNREEHILFAKGVSSRVVESLKAAFGQDQVEERRTDYVDATAASELRTDGILALLYALGVMLLYIAIRFDFYFSPGAIVALFHDVLVAMGVVVWFRLDFDLTLVAAFLTIVGYSINDTIVVYDRVREMLKGKESYEELKALVNRSVNDTLSRTLITSGTTFFVAISLAIFGGRSLQGFAIAMCVGIITGTYSSFAIATPMYLWLKKKYPHGIMQPAAAPKKA